MLGQVGPRSPRWGQFQRGQARPGNVALEWGGGQSEPVGAGKRTSLSPNQPDLQGQEGPVAESTRPGFTGPWPWVQGAAAISWLGHQGLGCPPPLPRGLPSSASGWQDGSLRPAICFSRSAVPVPTHGQGRLPLVPQAPDCLPATTTTVGPGPGVPWYLASENALREQRPQGQRLTSHRVALAQGGRKGELDREGVQEPIVRMVREDSE